MIAINVFMTLSFCKVISVNAKLRPVSTIVIVPDYGFIRGVNCISLPPVRVSHPNLFPGEVVLKRTVMACNLQEVAATEAVVSRC